jgi:hypothetical protein
MVREGLKKNNEIYLLTEYIKCVLWGLAVSLSCIQDAGCLEVNIAANILNIAVADGRQGVVLHVSVGRGARNSSP